MIICGVTKLFWKLFDWGQGRVRVSAVYENLMNADLGKEIFLRCIRFMEEKPDVKTLDIDHD
jgi:hypothetical protein